MPRPDLRRRRALLVVLALALCGLAAMTLRATAAPSHADDFGRQFFGLWRTRHMLLAAGIVWLALLCLLGALSGLAVRRFLALNAALVFAWGLLEVIGATGLADFSRLTGTHVAEQNGLRAVPHLDLSGTTREDLALLWNLPSPPIDYHFRTDSHGFRNEPDRPDADIYCVGDSYLVAGLLPFPQTLAAQLEHLLQRPVMNVALVGLSPQAECQLLRDAHLPLANRLVIHFIFEGNDLLDSAEWRAGPQPAPIVPWSQRTLASQLIDRLQTATQPQPDIVPRRTGTLAGQPYRFQWLANSFTNLQSELQPIADALAAERAEVQAAGARYAVVLIPATIRVLGPLCTFPPDSPLADWQSQCGPLPDFLQTWAAAHQIDYLDLTPALAAAAAAGRIPWFPADTHWNPIGHEVAAEALAAWPPVRALAASRPAQ